MTRRDELTALRPRDLIALADRLGVKVAASKNRVNLKEKKMNVVERILLAEESEEIDENAISPWDEVTMYDWSELDIFTKKVKKATKTRKPADVAVDEDKIAVLTELASAVGFEVLIRRKNAVALKKGKKRLIEMGIARGLFQIAAKPICVEGTDIEYRVMNGGDYISVKNLTRAEAEVVLNTMYENVPA